MRLLPHAGVHRSAPDADSLLPGPIARWTLTLVGIAGLITALMAARA